MGTQLKRYATPILILALWSWSVPSQAGKLSFQFDAAGRLTTATFAGGQSIQYAYAPSGNLTQRQITTGGGGNPDSDNDGMDDAWEQFYFGNLSRNGTGDFDNDRFLDQSEFLAGTLPNDPNSALKVLPNPTVGNSSVTIQWASVSGKQYRLQFKNSLSDGNWTDIPGDVTATSATSSKVDGTITGGSARFYRVLLVP